MKNMIKPFSCGTEALDWLCNNCDQCKRSYKPKPGEEQYPDFDETKKLVDQGRECKLKFDLDFAFVSGEMPEETAKQIGYNNGRLNQSCMMIIDDDGRGSINDDIKPIDDIPDNQLCLPFAMNEILNSEVEQSGDKPLSLSDVVESVCEHRYETHSNKFGDTYYRCVVCGDTAS